MNKTFHLQIISPAAVVMDAAVPMVEIPGVEGDFGVLPGHAPFFSMVRPGVITVYQPDGSRRRFFAASGYADVTPERCTVISDHIQDLSDISEYDAKEALAEAQAAVTHAADDITRAKAEKILRAAEALASAVAA